MDKAHEDAATAETAPVKITTNFDFTSLAIAGVVGLILLAIFVFVQRRRTARRDFLLTGLCEAGKTVIFTQILENEFKETFTSISENVGEYQSGRMSGRLVDIPGHQRVREKYFDDYKKTAKGVIFVVDSVTVQKEIRDVADALFSILSDSAILPCPILVLCNKQDLPLAKSAQVIKKLLEKEMNIIRETRAGKLESTAAEDTSKKVYLGREGKEFEFSQLPQNTQFYEGSALENSLDCVTDWIDRML